jgi:hypothetical protein
MDSRRASWLALACATCAWAAITPASRAADLPEYDLKAAFLYNFALFTEWPADVGQTVTLCIVDGDVLRHELDEFQGKSIGSRHFAARRISEVDAAEDCQMAFLPRASASAMKRSVRMLSSQRHVLIVGDSPEAAQAGVGINMTLKDARVTFDVNLKAVQDGGLNLSSKLLRLAKNVR